MASTFRNFLPFTAARTPVKDKKVEVLVNDTGALSRLVKIMGLALGFQGTSFSSFSNTRATFEDAPYDFNRIIQAIDTDSFVNQAFHKYKELMWKEGWEIQGNSQEAIDYLYNRINLMELVMRRPFQELMIEIGDQLVKFANCFLVKARGDINHLFPSPLHPLGKATSPVAGYYVIPAETVEIMRDRNNRPLRYRQRKDSVGGGVLTGAAELPIWEAADVIHFYVDRKPGRAFGTPFMVAGLDDVIAFRQIEEDVQNLVHRELFPFYKYKVGTETMPAQPEEIIQAAQELANLRTEGGLILPDRHDVEVIGAEGKAMDATAYLHHFQQRVISMLGMAPHHLGVTGGTGGNRSVTDRLDVALYDKVKHYQRYMSDMIRLLMFNEMLYEGGYDPINTPEDNCRFQFREIDVETQIKRDNHTIQKWVNNVIDLEEARMKMGEDAHVNEHDLFLALQARMSPNAVTTIRSGASGTTTAVRLDNTPVAAVPPGGTDPSGTKPPKMGGSVPAKPGQTNKPNLTKGVGNQSRPTNQHGTRSGPIVRHSEEDEKWITEVLELLGEDDMI